MNQQNNVTPKGYFRPYNHPDRLIPTVKTLDEGRRKGKIISWSFYFISFLLGFATGSFIIVLFRWFIEIEI